MVLGSCEEMEEGPGNDDGNSGCVTLRGEVKAGDGVADAGGCCCMAAIATDTEAALVVLLVLLMVVVVILLLEVGLMLVSLMLQADPK